MSKVKCRICANEVSGMCKVKKVKVAINKGRHCEAYVYDEGKIKIRTKLPSVKLNYTEQEERRKAAKVELKKLKKTFIERKKEALKSGVGIKSTTKFDSTFSESLSSGNSKYPSTGDLSRFITTADTKE